MVQNVMFLIADPVPIVPLSTDLIFSPPNYVFWACFKDFLVFRCDKWKK